MLDAYYYRTPDRKILGPFTKAAIAQFILDRTITIETLVWDVARDHGGLGQWQPAWQALGYPREPGTNRPAKGLNLPPPQS